MKKFLLSFFAFSLFMFGTMYFVANATILNSNQVGTNPVSGSVLQTNGATSTWVTTSSLGISGSSASATLLYASSGIGLTASGTNGYIVSNTGVTSFNGATGTVTFASSSSVGPSTSTFVAVFNASRTITGTSGFVYVLTPTSTNGVAMVTIAPTGGYGQGNHFSTEGDLNINGSNNTSSPLLQLYNNNGNINAPMLMIWNDTSTNPNGDSPIEVYDLATDPNPAISIRKNGYVPLEFIDLSQNNASGAGTFQWDDRNDVLRFEGRNATDGGYDVAGLYNRPASGGQFVWGGVNTFQVPSNAGLFNIIKDESSSLDYLDIGSTSTNLTNVLRITSSGVIYYPGVTSSLLETDATGKIFGISTSTYITTSTNNFGGLTGNGTSTWIPVYSASGTFQGYTNLAFTSSTNTLALNGTLSFPSTNASGTYTYSLKNDGNYLEINNTTGTIVGTSPIPYNIVLQNCPSVSTTSTAVTSSSWECALSQAENFPDGSRSFVDWDTEYYPTGTNPNIASGWFDNMRGTSSILFPFDLSWNDGSVNHVGFTEAPAVATSATKLNANFNLGTNGQFSVGTAQTSTGAFVINQNGASTCAGIYDSSASTIYGFTDSLPSPTGCTALGGYYKGLGIGGSTANGGNPIFGVLNSSQSANGLGHTALTVYDTNEVDTFNNQLDNGSGAMTVSSTLTLSKYGSSGNPCLTVGATGIVATSTCGSGGGGVATTSVYSTGYLQEASSSGAITNSPVYSGSATSISIGTTTSNGIVNVVNASNTSVLVVSNLTGTTSSASAFSVKGNASTSNTTPVTLFQILSDGHMNSTGTTPIMGTCGGSPSVNGTDLEGTISVGSGIVTSCAMNFQVPMESSNYRCVVSDNSASAAVSSAVTSHTTSTVTFGTSATFGGGEIYYICMENF